MPTGSFEAYSFSTRFPFVHAKPLTNMGERLRIPVAKHADALLRHPNEKRQNPFRGFVGSILVRGRRGAYNLTENITQTKDIPGAEYDFMAVLSDQEYMTSVKEKLNMIAAFQPKSGAVPA